MPDKPIVHTEPDNTSVDLNLQVTDPKQKRAIDAAFDSFFKEVDAGDGSPPIAPKADTLPDIKSVEPTQKAETKDVKPDIKPDKKPVKAPAKKAPDVPEEPVITKPAPSSAPEPVKESAPVAGDDDAEIDALPAPTHPKAKQDWERLRDHGKKNKALAKAYEDTFGDLAKEYDVKLPKSPEEAKEFLPKLKEKINEDRKRPAPKEVLDELEQHKAVTRKLGVSTNQQFAKEYVEPVLTSFTDIIDDTSETLLEQGAPKEAVEKWAGEMKGKYAPDKLGYEPLKNEFWQKGLLNQVADEFKRNTLFQKIQGHINLQKKLREKNDELVGSEQKFKAYSDEQLKKYNDWFYNEQFDEVSKTAKAIEDIHEWGMPKFLDGVTDEAKKKEIIAFNEAHKEVYDSVREKFTRWVNRLAGQPDPDEPNVSMPRWQGRAAMEIMKAMRLKEKHEAMVKELEELRSKVAKHEAELNRRAKVQSIPARPQSSGTVKSKPVSNTKLGKNVRDAFEDYEW